MYIEELKNGKFKYIQSYKDLKGNTKRISVTKSNKTRATQKQALEELNHRINEILNTNPTNKVVKPLKDDFLNLKKDTLTPHTFLLYKKTLEIIPDNEILKDITKLKYERKIIELRNTHSFKTLKVKVAILNNFFKYIKKYHLSTFEVHLEYTPTKDEKAQEIQKVKFLEKDEIQPTLDKIKNNTVKCIAIIQLYTGMRVGEVLALTPQDVDFNNKTINITKTKTQFDTITSPKTLTSIRNIEVSSNTLNIIKDFITQKEFIFDISYNTISYHLSKIGLKSHIFRHTHVALLIEQGIPIKVISKRLGHANTQTTLEIYTHVTNNMKDNLREKLENLSPFIPPLNP